MVLVYFYPKDFTPGCTTEACGLRDAYAEYEALGITILGISYDTPESHKAFKEEHNLPFTLLSDRETTTALLYGAKQPGRPAASRRSYLIDKQGILLRIIDNVDVATHSEDVLSYFQEQVERTR
ncbi:peroxiredoxin [Candidatus Neomarinimicrobiota bacterium]